MKSKPCHTKNRSQARRRVGAMRAPTLYRQTTNRLSLARERCAHGQALRAPERLEGIWIAHGRGELRVYGHRSGAVSGGAGGHELGVAWDVARVAPHRPAARLVAEHP